MTVLAGIEVDVIKEIARLAPTARKVAPLSDVATNTGHSSKSVGSTALYLEQEGFGTVIYPEGSGEPEGFRLNAEGIYKASIY